MDFSVEQIQQIEAMIEARIQKHTHDGNDSPQISPEYLLPFPTYTAAPTHAAPDGTIVLADVAGTRSIYVRIGSAWYSEVVT